jgi:hypothetical protein
MYPKWWNSIVAAVRGLHARDTFSVPGGPSSRAALLVRIAFLGFLAGATWGPGAVQAQSFCDSCEVQVGLGETYHYWAKTGSLVLPVSVSWDDNRYEFAGFRFTSQQLLPWPGTHEERHMANPYWGSSLSRRWRVFEHGPVQGYVGFGVSVKTEADVLSVTRWDFASQVGLRLRVPGSPVIGEVTMRHWSNGGIQLPNHGQDFATVTVRLNPRVFGFREADEIPINPTLDLKKALAENNSVKEEASLP